MPLLIGIALAIAVAAYARLAGLDRDRAFYPTVLIVVASLYILFAVMAGARAELPLELLGFAFFALLATLGFRSSLWIAAAGLVLHGVFDWLRPLWLAGSGVPAWWPAFCGGYDVAAGLILAAMLRFGRLPQARPWAASAAGSATHKNR